MAIERREEAFFDDCSCGATFNFMPLLFSREKPAVSDDHLVAPDIKTVGLACVGPQAFEAAVLDENSSAATKNPGLTIVEIDVLDRKSVV